MKEAELSYSDRKWFMSFMQSNSEPYSIFAMGVERILQWICKLSDIKDATAFPRMLDHIYP